MTHTKCPECGGTVRSLSASLFCLDCDWDDLPKIDFGHKTFPVDACWYTKTQLMKYRRWNDTDFQRVSPDWIQESSRWRNGTYYFYCETVESHEATPRFLARIPRFRIPQRPVPEEDKITVLAWTVCIRGDELIKNGWTHEMIDALPVYKNHSWRTRRLFRLCDLSEVSKIFCFPNSEAEKEKRFIQELKEQQVLSEGK